MLCEVAQKARVQIAVTTLSGKVLGKLFTPIVPLFTKQKKLVAALLRVAGVTAGLAESNDSLSPGL